MKVVRARLNKDRVPNFITFQGTYINGEYLAFFDLIDNLIPTIDLEQAIIRDSRYIKYILACDTVRFVLRPYYPDEDNNGFQYPYPSQLEKDNLSVILRTFSAQGLNLFPVFVLPDRANYVLHSPLERDTFYCNNYRTLIENQVTFIQQLLPLFPSYRWLDFYGDYDPVDIYSKGLVYQNEWFELLAEDFLRDYISFPEVVGCVHDPEGGIVREIEFLRTTDTPIYSFQLYTDNTNYDFDFISVFERVREVADRPLLIEEAGSNTLDFTDDGDNGRRYFGKVFEARNRVLPEVPVGIWCWGGHTTPDEWEWSMNRNIWDIRPCWWYIQEGASGLMWDIETIPKVHATRKFSNYLVFKDIPRNSKIFLKKTALWDNHVKDGECYFGQWDRPIGANIGDSSYWWRKGEHIIELSTPDLPDLELWLSVDFNWVDSSLYATIELLR